MSRIFTQLLRRINLWALTIPFLFLGTGFSFAQSVTAPSVRQYALSTNNQDASGFVLNGFATNDVLLASVGLVNPPTGTTLSITTTTGLTLSVGYSGWTGFTRRSFTGTMADINAALASLKVSTGSATGDVKITVSASVNPDGFFYLPTNGHFYKPMSWPSGTSGGASIYSTIKNSAAATSFRGQSGYLVTITNQDEQDFINLNVPGSNILIALTDEVTEGVYKWDTGPEAGTTIRNGSTNVTGQYNNWCGGEPNNWGSGEDYVVTKWGGSNCWNDYGPPASSFPASISGYVIEYGTWSNPDDQTFTDTYSNSVVNGVGCNTIPTIASVANQTVTDGSQTAVVNFSQSATNSGYQWMTFNSISSSNASATGQNGITMSITQSGGGMGSHNGMYSNTRFPATYNIPAPPTTTIMNTARGVFTVTFSQPVTNPLVAFASVGSPNNPVPVIVSAPFTPIWTDNATPGWVTTYDLPNNKFTGREGFNIIRIDGTVTTISFDYTVAEYYCTMAFGFEDQNVSFNWTNSAPSIGLAASGTGNILPFTAVNSGTSPVVATIRATPVSAGGCSGTPTTFTITVNPSAVPGTLSGAQSVCVGSNSQFSTDGTAGGAWSSSNTAVATVNSSGLVTGVGAGTAIITYTIGGSSSTRTVTVTAASNAGTLSGTDAICLAGTSQLATSGTSGGTWTSSTTGVATVSSSGLVTAVSAGTSTITYTVAGTGGCNDASATRTVTVTTPPASGTLSGTQTVFAGATTTFASTVTGGAWTSSNTAVATVNASTGVVTGVAAGTATITYTVAGTGGCSSASATRTVTVYTCPTIPALSASAYPVCAESNFTLTAAGLSGMASLSSGIIFKYSTTALSNPYVGGTVIATVPFASLEAGNTIARTTTSLAAGGTYYIYAILSTTPDGTGCLPYATTTLVVNPKGQVTLPASSLVCHGTSISAQTLTTTNSGGTTTYAWTNSATSIGLAASGSTATIPAFTATNTGSAGVTATISVTPSYTDGGLSCPGATSSYTVTVNPVPALSSVANQVICNASTGAVSFNSTTNPAQTLSVSSGAISVTIPDGNAAGITNALTATIPTGATITGIAVNFNITHTWNSDMIINLVAPNGQILNLVNGRGGSSDNFTNTTISSASTTSLATGTAPFTGTFAADAASGVGPTSFLSNAANFAALYSGTTSGSWRLALRDRFSGDVGTLTSWSITFTYTPVPSVSWTNSNTAIGLAASGTGNISFTATNPGPDQISSTITATPTYDNAGLTCSGTPITFTIAVNPSGQVNAVSNQVLCNTSATSAVTFSTTNNGLISTGGTQTATSGTISVTVPDASATGATHTIPVSLPTGAVINNMRVTLNLTHTWISDMVINLKAPNGQVLNLFNQHGGLGDNLVNTVVSSTGTTSFTSSSAPFTGTFAATAAQNQGPTGYASNAANFAALYSTPNGNWVLALRDLFLGDVGVLTSWSISFDYTVQGTFGTNMNWTNSNATIGLAATGTGNIPSFTAVNNGGTPIVSTVTVTPSYFNGGTSCPGTPTTFTYTVNPTPTVNAVAGQVFCAGTPSTVNFSGIAAGTVYSWTNSNTAIGLAASGTGSLSFTPTNTGTTPIIATITVTPSYTNAGVTCTGTPRTFTITVNPVGQANEVLSQVLCNGSNTTAVNFATVNGGGTIVAGTPVVTNSGTISILVPDANAGGASHTIPVTLPAGATVTGVSVNFNMDHTWVSDMVFNLKAPNGQILNLVNRRGGAGVNFTNTTISSAGTASLATGTAPFTGTFAADAAIGVGPTGQLSSAANYAALYAVGSGDWTLQMRDYVGGDVGTLTSWSITINYTTLVPAVTSYAWTNNLYSIGLAASGTGNIASFAATNTTAAPVTATVTVTPTYTNAGVGCAGTPISYTYTVNPTPTVNAVSNQTVCVGSNVAAVTFTGATTGTVYNWTNSNTAIGLAASGTGNIASFVGTNTTAAPISGTITVTPVYTNAGVTCTGTPRTFTITVNPIPTVNAVANFAACHNTTAEAAFSGATTGTVFNWTNSNPAIGLPASGSGNISFTALNTTSAPVTATITVTPSYTNGGTTCVGTPTSFVITVNPLPVVTTGTLPGRICISDTLVRLNGTPVGGSWSGFGISGFNFMPPATDVGTWPITYTYADANGCVNSASTTVTVLACEERNRDLDNGAVVLYPNPNSGQFNLRVNSTRFNVLGMKVYNTTGQLVYVNQWRGLVFARVIPVNLNNLAAGTYMVRLYYGDGMDRGADKTYQVIIAR